MHFKRKYNYLLVLLLYTGLLQAQFSENARIPGTGCLTVVSSDDISLRLTYTAPEPEFSQLKIGSEEYFSITLAGHNPEAEAGMPAVPVYSSMISLTGRKVKSIRLSNVKTSRHHPSSAGFSGQMVPAIDAGTKGSGIQDNISGQQGQLYRQEKYYRSPVPYISDTVSIEKIGTIRGNDIGSIMINPVIYYPTDNFIDIITEMSVEITYDVVSTDSQTKSILKSASASTLLEKGLIDYDPADVIPGFSLQPVGMVIIADTIMKRHLRPLIEWKTRKGFRVTEIYIGENGITKNFVTLKDQLSAIYNSSTPDNPAPEYLLLAGDLNYIPASQGTTWLSDMYYAEFDGNGDYLPDMYTGRLPAKDTTQMKAIVKKILQYEQFGFGDTINHYKSALAFAGYDLGNVTFMNGQVKYAAGYLNPANGITSHIMLHSINDSVRAVRYDSVRYLLNDGLGFVNYTGHGDANGWLNTGINYNTVNSLTNISRYPVIISNACQTANYSSTNCFGSTFVRAAGKGALAFIGCSNDSYWTEDYYWSVGVSQITENPLYEESGAGFYDRLFHLNNEVPSNWYVTLGQILFAGNMAVSESNSSKKKYYWETYTLLGDPSVTPYIGAASTFSESLPDSIPRALRNLTITTEPFAYVAISHFDTLWDASHASPSGAVILNIPDVVKDSCMVIMTGQNKIPYIKTLYFSDPDTAWLSIADIKPNDIAGDRNGRADYSEIISLDVDLQNAGAGIATDTYILLQSDSEFLTILSDSVFLGNIAGLSDINLTELFEIRINDNIPDLEIVTFNLTLHQSTNTVSQHFDMSLHSPEPVILNCYTDDSITGNGNNLAEAGEKVTIYIRVSNTGSSSVSGVLFITGLSGYINFDQNSVNTGIINPDEIIELAVDATISPDTPEATSISFETTLDCSPYSSVKTLSIFSGKSTEDFELQNFTTFPWKNSSTYPWLISENESYRNSFSARSGLSSQNHNQKSVLSLNINLPENDTMSFWYKVSSESGYDWLRFEVDSVLLFRESGQTDWLMVKVPLKKGVHLLQWIYVKDASLSEGLDCAWIDFLRFPELSFLKRDISLNRIISPVPYTQYHNEPVTIEITNLGRDTINALDLTYVLNDNSPVSEIFYQEIIPGDTVNVTFTSTADLAEPGNYFIDIFPTLGDEYAVNDTVRGMFISYNYLIQVGPNPFNDRISFISQGHYENIRVEIYSTSGILMHEQQFEQFLAGEMVTMNMPYLPKGMYVVKVHTAFGTKTYKIIKI